MLGKHDERAIPVEVEPGRDRAQLPVGPIMAGRRVQVQDGSRAQELSTRALSSRTEARITPSVSAFLIGPGTKRPGSIPNR